MKNGATLAFISSKGETDQRHCFCRSIGRILIISVTKTSLELRMIDRDSNIIHTVSLSK